ncbi:MerR family transcriptional regulator [Streptomyces puniciscabiei]|uniref:MerR family transcriptional regulator n=1 Tax=Streptomyces puniciscabiei TaxID=164348 RepID=UPI0037976D70
MSGSPVGDLLRCYEGQGLLHPGRGDNGYRSCPESSVADVQQIRALLDSGPTTGMIRAICRTSRARARCTRPPSA